MKYSLLSLGYVSGLVVLVFLTPLNVYAQYSPLIPIPGLEPGNFSMEEALKMLYILAISVAALIAVGKLMWAGFQYITSALVTDKESAKKDIRSAIIGLMIILLAVTILRTINTELTNLPKLDSAPLIKGVPREGVIVNITDLKSREEILRNCNNIIKLSGDLLCCNDRNECRITTPTQSTLLKNFDPNKVYEIADRNKLILDNSDLDIVYTGLADLYSDEERQRQCEQVANTKGKVLLEVVIINENIGRRGTRLLKEGMLCIIE